MTSTNAPTKLRDDGVFTLNDYTLVVDFTNEVVIAAPVTAVVLFDGKPQEDLVVTPTVTGRRVTATLTVAQMVDLPKKKASLNILFNGVYVIQKPLTPTTDGSVPTTTTALYSNPDLGVFRVSFYHGDTQAALTEADRIACEAARDYIDDAMIQINDRVPSFLNDLAATILAGQDATYTSVGANPLSASSGLAGATIDAPNKILTIPLGSTGSGSYMRQDFDIIPIANSLRVNDKINIRCVVNQTVDGAISDSVLGVRVFTSTGTAVPVTTTAPALYDSATKTFTLDAQFTVTNVSFTYYVELYVKGGAPAQPAAVNLRWLDVGVNQDKYLYNDAIALIDQAVRAYRSISVTYDDRPVVTQIDLSGVTDVTAALQAELNLAVSTSGKWEGRPGIPRITGTLAINGRLEMDFRGMDLNAAIASPASPASGSEAFVIVTPLPVIFRNLIVRRNAANPTHNPTFCRFSAAYINKNSIFDRVEIYNMPRSMTVDYCDGLTIQNCYFAGGQFYGLRAGASAPGSMTNLTLRENIFAGYLDNHAQIYNMEGLLVDDNIFQSASTTTVPLRSLEIIPSGSGVQKNARFLKNQFLSFREYGLSIVPVAGVTARDIMVMMNYFDDRTPDTTDNSSRPMHFQGIAQNIDMLTVALNDVFSKEIGLRADNVKVAKFLNNNFYKSNVGGAYAASQAMLGSNLTFASSGNFVDPTLGVATNKATWGTELVTI